MINMEFDFENDLIEEVYSEFKHYGIKLPINDDLRTILLNSFTIKKKLIYPKKRCVKYMSKFKGSREYIEKSNEIKYIEKRLQEGRDVNFFQSKRSFESNFHDHLVYEWNIYHFHLSLEVDKKNNKFVKQVKQLLFAYIDDTQVIFLGIDNHSKGAFGNIKWLEILHDYFPVIIEPFYDSTILDITPKLTSLERQTLWDKGYTIGMTKVRGKVYHNPGVGRSTTGHSIVVLMQVDKVIRWVHEVSEQLKDHYSNICEFLKVDSNKAQFKLRLGLNSYKIVEEKTNQTVLTFPDIINQEVF